MGRLLPTHHGPHADLLPPSGLVESMVDADTAHDYWSGDFRQYDNVRVAVLVWGPPNHNRSTFVVARLRWVYRNNAQTIERLSLRNTCGLVTCVRTDHFERSGYVRVYTLDAPLVMRDGVEVYIKGVGVQTHLMPADVQHALCGYRPRLPDRLPWGTRITCNDCALAALGNGYVLKEIHVNK